MIDTAVGRLVSARELLFNDCRDVRESSWRGYTESIDLLLQHHIARDPESGAVVHDGTNMSGTRGKRGPYTLFVPIPGTCPRWYGREFRASNDAAAVERANELLPVALRRAVKEAARG